MIPTSKLISIDLKEEYPSAHPNAHCKLLQGINNKLNLKCYNLFTHKAKHKRSYSCGEERYEGQGRDKAETPPSPFAVLGSGEHAP